VLSGGAGDGAGRRIRVLHVVLDLHAGGLERLVGEMVRAGDASRFEYHILALAFLGRFAAGLEGVARLHPVPARRGGSLLWPAPLMRSLRQIAPDVIHAHSGVWIKTAWAACWAGRPGVVQTEHGRNRPDPWHDRLTDWWASLFTDQVVAVSEVLGDQLRRTVVAHPGRVRVIRNGVNTAEFAPAPDDGTLRRELGLDLERPIVGSIGRLEPIKGYDVMVEAFALVLRQWTAGVRPVLVVAGDGGELESLRARVAELGLERDIFLLGWRSDLVALLRAFTLFTMTSRSEGTSVSLLEAMSTGLCPVVTNVGGNAAVLGPDLAHRLVPSQDPAAIAEGWRVALEQEDARRADGSRARARVEAEFSLAMMVRSYEALYLVASRAAPAL
jgi:glycosyltransferase involved in cell wall biosynthesis